MDPISLMFINQHPTSQAKVGRQNKLRRSSSIPIGMSVVLLRGRVDAGSVILQFSGSARELVGRALRVQHDLLDLHIGTIDSTPISFIIILFTVH